MGTLSDRMRLNYSKTGVENAHIIKNAHLGMNYYETFTLICATQKIDMLALSDEEFESAAHVFEWFVKDSVRTGTGILSVWFD